MNPISALQAIGAAIAAFVLGAIVAGVPGYLVGRGHGAAAGAEQVGACKVTIDGANAAAIVANKAADAERVKSDELNGRLNAAEVLNQTLADLAARNRGAVLQTPLRGSTECERAVNMIDDLWRKGAKL